MKTIIMTSLFCALLFFSGFAWASPYQSSAASNLTDDCSPITTYQRIFTNPHTGWVTIPVEIQPGRCSSRL